MQHREDHWYRELEVEPDRDEDGDQEERDDDPVDRVNRDLVAERPGDALRAAREDAEIGPEGLSRVVLLLPRQRFRAHLPVLEIAVHAFPLALDDGVGLALARHDLLHLCLRVRLVRLEGELRPALEIDAEIEPLRGERDHACEDDGARYREPQLALSHEVDLEPLRRLLALGTHEARAVEPAEAAEQAEHRARRDDRGEQRDHGADQQHQGEALHVGDRDQVDDHRRDHGHDVRVENRVEALPVACRDGGPHRSTGSHLFLDAFEHDDVRVGRDADREDQAREARQRQRHVEEQDRGVVEGRVDGEAEDRHEPQEAVQDEEEDRNDEQSNGGCPQRLVK